MLDSQGSGDLLIDDSGQIISKFTGQQKTRDKNLRAL